MSPERRTSSAAQSSRSLARPHIAEWFGHRVFPRVSMGDRPISDQQSQRCPFLTETLKASTQCVKAANSRGVCTISATSNGPRQDWLVCPYRALDDGLLADIVKRLYGIPALDPVLIRPVVVLNDEAGRTEILAAISGHRRMFVYFQDKLGGEIGLSKTAASPELSFDITVVELTAGPVAESPPGLEQPGIRIGKYGVIELQTTDTHGSYQHAVTALTNALDLHAAGFPEVLAANPAPRTCTSKPTAHSACSTTRRQRRPTGSTSSTSTPNQGPPAAQRQSASAWSSAPTPRHSAAPHSKSRQLEPLSTEEALTPSPKQSHAGSAATYPESADNPAS